MLVIDLKIANFWNLVQVALYVILDFFFSLAVLSILDMRSMNRTKPAYRVKGAEPSNWFAMIGFHGE